MPAGAPSTSTACPARGMPGSVSRKIASRSGVPSSAWRRITSAPAKPPPARSHAHFRPASIGVRPRVSSWP